MSVNIESTVRTDNVENRGGIGAMTTAVVTKAVESQDAMDNEKTLAIIVVLSIVQSSAHECTDSGLTGNGNRNHAYE